MRIISAQVFFLAVAPLCKENLSDGVANDADSEESHHNCSDGASQNAQYAGAL